MKKYFLFAGIIAWTLSQTSCLNSLQPLVSHDKVIVDNRVAGIWLKDDTELKIDPMPDSYYFKETQKLSIKEGEKEAAPLQGKQLEDSIFYSKTYMISYRADSLDYYFIAALIKIGRSFYFDLYPADMGDTTDKPYGRKYSSNTDYLQTFTIAKLEIAAKDKLLVTFIDGEFVKKQIMEGKVRIKHENDDLFDTFLVTATSSELQRFVEKYGDDERLFKKKDTVTLNRKEK